MARPAQVMQGDGPVLDWELVYDLHAPKLRRTIQRRVGAALVEDVLQETFLLAFKNRGSIDPSQPIGPWLGTIAVRASTAVYRRQLRTVEATQETVPEPDAIALDALEEEFFNRARRVGIKHAFASLSERQRRVLHLVTVEGMSYACAADVENTTPEAVKSLVARARTNFRCTYSDFGKQTGLYGLGAFGVLRRLRRRFQNLHVLAGGHVAGVSATAATVAVVVVAVAPIVHQAATSAAEHPTAVATVVPSTAAGNAGGSSAGSPEPGGAAGSTGAGPTATSDSGARTTVRVHRSGNHAGATVTAEATTPAADRRAWLVFDVQCDKNLASTVECAVIDATVGLPLPD